MIHYYFIFISVVTIYNNNFCSIKYLINIPLFKKNNYLNFYLFIFDLIHSSYPGCFAYDSFVQGDNIKTYISYYYIIHYLY